MTEIAGLTRLYVDDPEKLKTLHESLVATHETLSDIDALDVDCELVHTASVDKDWEIILKTSTAGQLLGASAVRHGSERYDYVRTEGGSWSAKDIPSRFVDTHFSSLVSMATKEGLDWSVAPAA